MRTRYHVDQLPHNFLNDSDVIASVHTAISHIETALEIEHDVNVAYNTFADLVTNEMARKLEIKSSNGNNSKRNKSMRNRIGMTSCRNCGIACATMRKPGCLAKLLEFLDEHCAQNIVILENSLTGSIENVRDNTSYRNNLICRTNF